MRLTIEFESAAGWAASGSSLALDLVDYPGEWLLDLPLLDKTYAEWSRETLAASRTPARAPLSAEWRAALVGLDPQAHANEDAARQHRRIVQSLSRPGARRRLCALDPAARPIPHAGRSRGFAGATFAPVALGDDDTIAQGSLAAMMARRYEAYKAHVVKPFFRDHFARLDRQIVLVDALSALNSGRPRSAISSTL